MNDCRSIMQAGGVRLADEPAGLVTTVTQEHGHPLPAAGDRDELLDPRSDHRSVTEIARRWGLCDLTSFGRAFRAAYGVPPTEYRARRPRA